VGGGVLHLPGPLAAVRRETAGLIGDALPGVRDR
jgi:hypothetical protein